MLFSLFGLLVLFLLPDLSGKNEVRPKQNPNFVDSEEELLELRPVEWSKEWYYVNTGKQSVGPVSMSTLVKLWKAGQIQLATLVWSEGMDGWKKIEDLRSLKTCLDKD
nr:DUF4339 domain-containing protein [Parachlamydia sp. AcF125]